MKKFRLLMVVLVVAVTLLPVTAFAGSTTNGGITLNYPGNMVTCSPKFHFTTTGVGDTWPVKYTIFKEVAPGVLATISSGSTTGNLDFYFSPTPLTPGTTAVFAISVAVTVPGQELPTKLNGKWTVECEKEPPSGGQGCTPGYWRQEQHFDSWTSYSPWSSYDGTFGVNGSFDTLLAAVWARGGGENALARHAVAALLNASSPGVNYAFSTAQVIAMVQQAYSTGNFENIKNQFEYQNELGCPLN